MELQLKARPETTSNHGHDDKGDDQCTEDDHDDDHHHADDDGADGDDRESDNEDDSEASGDGSSCMMYRHDARSRSPHRDKHRHPYNLDRICASVASYQPNIATRFAASHPGN